MWEKKPILFLVLAVVAILVGTIVTMVVPFAWINTEADKIATVTPYTPLELAGRDVYIQEGCNNCHSQTVRPLVSEVVRYGDYSKSGEFRYDRPFLWGSRRTGPDLARIGGKYPDGWHYHHMENPQAMVPQSNMPSYAFLDNRKVDPAFTRKKMEVLDFPYTEKQIKDLEGKSEMDAIIAYLQKLGTGINWREKQQQTMLAGNVTNPFRGKADAVQEGKKLYNMNCVACHGVFGGDGKIGPALADLGMEDTDLFPIIMDGISDAGMPSFRKIGTTKVWKIITFLNKDSE